MTKQKPPVLMLLIFVAIMIGITLVLAIEGRYAQSFVAGLLTIYFGVTEIEKRLDR